MAGVSHQKMKTSSYNGYFLLMICMFTVVYFAAAQSSDYLSESSSGMGLLPCSYKGTIFLHDESWQIDECFMCRCDNSTIKCGMIHSCEQNFCESPVKIEGQCCDVCPYYVPIYELDIDATNATTSDVGLKGLNLRMKIHEDGQTVHGGRLWKVGMWLSDSEDGFRKKYQYVEQVLDEVQDNTKLRRPPTPGPFEFAIDKINYIFPSSNRVYHTYLCAEFGRRRTSALLHDGAVPFDVVGVESQFSSRSDPSKLVTCVKRSHEEPQFEVAVVGSSPEYLTYVWSALSNNAPNDYTEGYTYMLSDKDDVIVNEGAINETTITIHGLQCDARYVFNVVSTKTASSWIPSILVTRTGLPEISVTQIESRAMSESSLYFAWNAPEPCNVKFDLGYKYRLYNSNSRRLVSKGVVSNSEITISGLDCNTTYYFMVATTSRKATSNWSDQVTATTLSTVSSEAPPSVELVEMTSNRLRFTWDEVSCANRNGLIQRYVYQFDTIESDETGETEIREITITPNRHFNISTEYRFRVAAATSAGSGPWTQWVYGSIRDIGKDCVAAYIECNEARNISMINVN